MKRSTVRLIHSIAYRRALARDLPQLEAELAEQLEIGREYRTRRYVVTRREGILELHANDSPQLLRQIPLALSIRDPRAQTSD